MSDYILRSEAIRAVTTAELPDKTEDGIPIANGKRSVTDCVRKIKAIPSADVQPVVRCKDCKHRDPDDKKCDCGGLEHAHMFPVSDDWYCADGERMDGET